MKKIFALISIFLGSFLFAASQEEMLLPNGIVPEAQHINTTWGMILFFMWPVFIIIAYKFIEFTLKKTGVETDL